VAAGIVLFTDMTAGMLGGNLGPLGMVALVLALVMSAAVLQVFTQVLIRGRRFRSLAALRVANNGGTTIAQVLAGLLFAGQAIGLAVGAIAGGLIAVLFGGRGSRAWLRGLLRERPAAGMLGRLVAVHAKFPLYVLPYAFVTLIKDRGLIVVFAIYGDTATAGALVAAQRLVSIPVGLITSSIAPVLHQRLASAAEPGLLADGVGAVLRVVIMVAAPLYILLALTAGTTVPWVLGSAWRDAADFTAVLCISSFTLCLSGLFDRSLDLKSKQHVALGIEASSGLLSLLAGVTVIRTTGNAVHALLAFVVCEAIHHLVWIGAVCHVNRWPLGQLRRMAGPLLLAVTATALVYVTLPAPGGSVR
jgi:O-antigen/teichoic acid export membrane protein